MVFVSSGGGNGGGGGPAAFTKEFNRIVAEVPEAVEAITGVDLRKAIESLASSGQTGGAIVQGAAEGVATAMVSKSN